jgi:hypothetical protein
VKFTRCGLRFYKRLLESSTSTMSKGIYGAAARESAERRRRRDARIRRRDRRRGLRRHVHAPSRRAVQAFTVRLFEAGSGVGWHVVLEPLSGRALRRREHGVFLPVLESSQQDWRWK